jgi:hypothetical protein
VASCRSLSRRRLVVKHAVVAALTIVALASCSVAQLSAMQFHKDNRLHFTSPKARTVVALPLHVAWTFPATATQNVTFGVFADRAAMAVGKGLKSLAAGDPSCQRDPRCPDRTYLANIGVYLTNETSLQLSTLPRVGGVGNEHHTITIVLLDRHGIRRTESSWYVDFYLPRRS